jgi:two-component sensor histidine kinase
MGDLATLSALRGDGSEFPIEASISQGKVGDQTLFTVILRDVTERKRHEERRETLVGELNHRVKNTLAVVLSLARQTLATATGLNAFEQAFMDRVQALARAHDLLTSADWTAASLADVAHYALSPFGLERFEIGGPEVMLAPSSAVTLTLAFNELATNATKYGALSAPPGQIALTWRKQVQTIELIWRESGGPNVAPPTRLGFGSRLIQQVIAYEFDGKSELAYPPEGATCRMKLPLNSKGRVGSPS